MQSGHRCACAKAPGWDVTLYGLGRQVNKEVPDPIPRNEGFCLTPVVFALFVRKQVHKANDTAEINHPSSERRRSMQHTTANSKYPNAGEGFNMRVGSTVYRVNVHFSRTSKETAKDKIIRLVRSEAEKAVKE
jgi:hypothetical protein